MASEETEGTLQEILANQREIIARQTGLEEEFRSIRRLLEQQHARQPHDAAAITALLAEVHRIVGSEPFTAHSVIDASTFPDAEPLRQALAGLDAQRLGKLLAKVKGRNFSGLHVERLARTKSRDGWEWRVLASMRR